MGTRERQDREREALRRAILHAARELFVAEGYRNVSMRKIAERIEYSPAAIYGYFESKDDIFFALAEEGFRLLFRGRPDAPDPHAPPVERVREIFWHFYEFSRTHPEYFELMFVDSSVPRISRDWERFGFVRESRQQCAAVIQECIDLGLFPGATNPHAVFRVLSTAIYGAAVFRLTNRLPADEDADALARAILDTALAGLRAGAPITLTVATGCPADEIAAAHNESPRRPASRPRRAAERALR